MTAKNDDCLLRENQNGITTLILNRPDQFNALSKALLERLELELKEIRNDNSVRVVIIRAKGRAYCVGHDLKEMRNKTDKVFLSSLFTRAATVMQIIESLPQPVIASVHSVATAGGCQLVAACDLAIASETAKFAVSGIKLGLFCSTPAVALTRNISRKRAMEMLLTGDFIDAQTALEYGLINKVVPADSLDKAVQILAKKIAAKPRVAVEMGKALFYQQLNQPLDKAYEIASETISSNMLHEDTLEGVDAFIEKRKPKWL
jgi:enoyl-CoA hydratase/carnithine racemase